MSGHTPGPWKYDGSKVIAYGRGIIAEIPVPGKGGVFECHANVRLIAAAPDLLEALRKCLPSSCQAAHPASPDYQKGKECGKCGYCIGKAAITKAEGTNP